MIRTTPYEWAVLKRRDSTWHRSLPICRQICRDVGVDLFPMNWRSAHDPLFPPACGARLCGIWRALSFAWLGNVTSDRYNLTRFAADIA